jgi:nicotinamidase-related amidase
MPQLPNNTVLLLIDLQKAIDDPSWGVRNNPQAEQNVARLLSHWRAKGMPVIHVRHVSRDPNSTYRDGQPGVAFKDAAQPIGSEVVVTKHVCTAFVGTDLEPKIRAMGAEDVAIAGVITNNSVESTARMCGDLGFRTIVVSDATFTFGRMDFSGQFRSADEVHAMSLANLDGEYAGICTTDQILEMTRLLPESADVQLEGVPIPLKRRPNMRKDIFVVGARLLGLWQLIGALSSLAYIASNWAGYFQPSSSASQYYYIKFLLELVVGIYFVFRPHQLFDVIEHLAARSGVGVGEDTE